MNMPHLVITFVIVVLLAGCQVLRPPVQSYRPVQQCGTLQAVIEPPAELARWPYLQSVGVTSATIAWGTQNESPGQLLYGPVNAPAAMQVTATTAFEIPLQDGPLAMKAVRLNGLTPDSQYCYAIQDSAGNTAGGFLLSTAPSSPNTSVRFLVVGDFGVGSRVQERIRDQMLLQQADLLLTTGDNAYLSGTFDQFEDNVFDVYRLLFSRMPVFPTPGNHDYRTERARPYLTNFFLPENAALEPDKERYYSFDWGAVHFVALDSEAPLREAMQGTPNMLTWLDADLRANQRPWTVVYLHRPAYSTSILRGGEPLVRERIVPTLEKYNVPIVFAGHNHVYERFHPIRNGEKTPLNKGGVVYVTTGGGGAPSYAVQNDTLLARGSNLPHFIHAEADACTLQFKAIDDQGKVIDRFAMRQCWP